MSGNATGIGSILTSIHNKLNDGTLSNITIRMVVDENVNPNSLYNIGGASPFYSLNSLAGTTYANGNAFYYDRVTSTPGIMHNKFNLFDYGPGNRWVNTSSANLTGGAAIFQHNITFEIRNDTLYSLYAGEANQLMGTDTNTADGIVHNNPAKSHAFDSPPTISFDGGIGLIGVRFAPYVNDTVPSGNNAASDIINAINNANHSILLGTNKLTDNDIAQALVAKANAGVEIHLIIPQSDVTGESAAVMAYLNNPANYATPQAFANFHTYTIDRDASTPGTQPDQGSPTDIDLLHTKYIVIDAGTANATVFHGSANLTNAALNGTNQNDENQLQIKHTGVANAFVQHAQFVTNNAIPPLPVPEPSTWLLIILGSGFLLTQIYRKRASTKSQ
jgi:phosphatidylserine/phosphatidylglycerophosphate/cardiolipin synthase-like enzyme